MKRMALLRGFGLAAAMLPASWLASSAEADPWDAYAASIYDYCDAKKVAWVWNTSIEQAKVVIGEKIINNLVNLLEQDIASTSRRVRCDLEDISLSYNDAEKLAHYWGRSVQDAKLKAMDLASQHGGGKFRAMMAHVIGFQR